MFVRETLSIGLEFSGHIITMITSSIPSMDNTCCLANNILLFFVVVIGVNVHIP